jgi:hypothetical protein
MRKRKHFYTVVCLVIGVIILTTAAAANFENANGYTAYKTALKNMLYQDNFSMNLTTDLIYNDATAFHTEHKYMFDKDGDVSEYNANTETEGERTFSNENWLVKDPDPVDDQSDYLTVNKNDGTWNINRSYGRNRISEFGRDETSQKAVRFVELLADTFVGDLKNNFVLTSDENGVKSYQIILSGNQLPEYVSAGISMLYSAAKQSSDSFVAYDKNFKFEGDDSAKVQNDAYNMLSEKQNKGVVFVKEDGKLLYFESSELYFSSEYYKPNMTNIDDVLRTLNSEPTVETAKCFITVDKDGRLLSNAIEGTLSAYDKAGNKHTLTLRVNAELSDYGTTVIDKPVIPDGDTVYDYSKQSPENKFSYTVTENGVVTTFTSEKTADESAVEAEAVSEDPDSAKTGE